MDTIEQAERFASSARAFIGAHQSSNRHAASVLVAAKAAKEALDELLSAHEAPAVPALAEAAAPASTSEFPAR